MASVRWQPWRIDTFEQARAEKKPVLLSIAPSWCASSREMDRSTYGDPEIAARIADRFVPLRVDPDRRPDISERYTLGGWPTTAFLTADGEVLGGGTFVPRARMSAILDRVVEAFASRRAEIEGGTQADDVSVHPLSLRPGSARTASSVAPISHQDHTIADTLERAVFASFDNDHGGFGTGPKFPLVAPLELALGSSEDSRARTAHVVESTLDAMGWGSLYDEVDGGFFRYATDRDWGTPHYEKLLDVNAALLRVYIEASEALGAARYRERAIGTLRYVQTWLADAVDGGWAASQQADAGYYDSSDDRRRDAAPPVDGSLYASWNAAMVSAALRAAEALDDTSLGEFALRSLERLVVACYRPGLGIAHCLDGGASVRGLLDDQVAMIGAHLDAHGATGNIVYEMMAQELAHYAVRTMWDDAGGGFFDRARVDREERVGLMRQRLKPFVGNCDAARAFRRLANTPGDHDFAARADATLAAMAPLAAAQGPLAAHYLLALRQR